MKKKYSIMDESCINEIFFTKLDILKNLFKKDG